MPKIQICLAFVLVCALCSTAAAQDSSGSTQRSTLTITANATGERVRITAPSSVVQMHVEVYAASGEKLFDQEIRGGNVFDWHLQDGQAQRLVPGAYVCVVTAKSVSGRITQKLGTVTVAEKSASVQSGSQQLSLQQTQAIGPVEADSSWTIAGENDPQTPTVIANDGSDGQMIRGRGALTFRVGNFFSGVDTEQMRLTEAGDLGIGTAQPQSKLDVAGTIRAERFLVVKPNLGNGDKTATATQATDTVDGVQPLVAGTGTQNQITKWTDNAGTLGDSVITETPAGKVGVGITIPLSKFHVSSSFDALRLTSTNDTTPVWAQFNTSLGTGLGYFGVEGNTSGTFLAGTLPYATALSSGGSGTALQLGSAGSVKMTILSGGNVGIGTTAPATPLEANGVLRSTRIGFGTQYLQLNGGDNTFIKLTAQSIATAEKPLLIQNLTGEVTPGANNNIQFQLGTPASPSTKMMIDKDGKVGIGTTSPETKLDVSAALTAIRGRGPTGVIGESTTNGTGVFGRSDLGVGVEGYTNSGTTFIAYTGSGNFMEGIDIQQQQRKFHILPSGTYVAGSDFAEALPASGDRAGYEPGDVLVISAKAPGKVEKARRPYDSRVAGVYSTRPGMLGADKQGTSRVDADDVPVAIVGIVPTKVSARNGAIRVGDLLTTSSTAGYAMRCANRVKCVGAILGKALEPLTAGQGVVKVLVMLR